MGRQRHNVENNWTEFDDAIRGSKEWCKGVAYVSRLCELTVLKGIRDPVGFGVAQDSTYEKEPRVLGGRATVCIERRMIVETDNPGRTLAEKLVGLGSILAHEMAHHALCHGWGRRYRDISAVRIDLKRKILASLEAYRWAKVSGVNVAAIEQHWAIAESAKAKELIEDKADELDDKFLNNPHAPPHDKKDFNALKESAEQAAHEWCAAVVGFVMAYRLTKGRDYALRMIESLQEIWDWKASSIGSIVMNAACQSPDAETIAEGLANEVLSENCNNSDIESHTEELDDEGKTWADLPTPATPARPKSRVAG